MDIGAANHSVNPSTPAAGIVETTVLLVEDDPAIVELTRITLEGAGFGVIDAATAEQALDRLKTVLPDVALIDWMLPGMSGLALAQRIRAEPRTQKLPIIMVTARAQETDRVTGLDQGADDYLTKPFSPRELVARIRAVLRRRSRDEALEAVVVGPLVLDPSSHTVRLRNHDLKVGPTEFKLLRFLMAQPGRAFTRAQLLDKVWGDHVFIEERTVDVHVRRLRLALGADAGALVETVRGIGYRLNRLTG